MRHEAIMHDDMSFDEEGFAGSMSVGSVHPVFSCNCIHNYQYANLEARKTASITGPVAFGEIGDIEQYYRCSEKRGVPMRTQECKTILLVEDENIIARAEAYVIDRFGYEVIVASSGEKAVSLATVNSEIDLILMDIDLGDGIDGLEAARRIHEGRDIPIVFLTSYSRDRWANAMGATADYGYVTKGSNDSVLRSSIDRAFRLFEAKEKACMKDRDQPEASARREKLRMGY
jgi:CheY-like chemotaxis protein